MANVLGELFSDIAQSIRSGLGGYNGTMKPVEFAGKIDEIVALLNAELESRPSMDGMASTSNLKIVSGGFRPEADRTRITIEHGLGVMPDLIIVYQNGLAGSYATPEELASDYPILSAWGIKSTFNTPTRSGLNILGWGFATAYGIDDMPAESRNAGYIYCPDEDTFQVGRQATDGMVGLSTNLKYYWIAISGIGSGAAEPVVQALTVTENGTYTPPEGVDGFGPVTVSVSSTETIQPIMASGTFTPTSSTGKRTLEHNLGVIPDCVIIYAANATVANNKTVYAIGFRSEFPFCWGSDQSSQQNINLSYGTGQISTVAFSLGIETSGSTFGGFKNANATTVQFGGSATQLDTSVEYTWQAVRIFP